MVLYSIVLLNIVKFIKKKNLFEKKKNTENTPLGSRMKWRMESTSSLVPSKTLSST